MPRRSRKHRLKQVKYDQKKKLRTEEPETPTEELPAEGTPQVGPSTSQPEPAPPPEQPEVCFLPVPTPEIESEEELTYTSQSSSIPEGVFEDSETQTSEVLPYYPEEPQEEESDPTFKELVEALGPIHLGEIKPGPSRPEFSESKFASPKPSTSRAHGEEIEQTYEAVVTQISSARLKDTYKIIRSFPGTLSLNEYSFQSLNVKNNQLVVIGVPRGVAFQYYDCKQLFLSIHQIDLYIIEKIYSEEQETTNPYHTHFYFPGDVYMCTQTDREDKFSKTHPKARVKKNVEHVPIKSVDDVISPLRPGYTRIPQYLFVKSPPFAKTEPSFPPQPSDLLYPTDFFELLTSAYENTAPELQQSFSYFRLIPGNFDNLLGVHKNSMHQEYRCCPKITVFSGIDLYFVGKERVDPNSEKVSRIKSNIHTHVQFPYGMRACMFKNTPTKYMVTGSCPHEDELTTSVHIPTTAVQASKTWMKTASMLKTTPEPGSTETSTMEEETEALESESSSSSSSAGKPNCYLELIAQREDTVFIGLPKEALCHHNPETNELEALTGVGVYFIKDSDLEVCPKASATASPHHVHLNFNTDAYVCRFEGDVTVYETEETCTRLSVPATTIMASSLNILPHGKPVRPTVAGRSRSERKHRSKILKTNPFAREEKQESSTPTLVPIMHDVPSGNLFGRIKTTGGLAPKVFILKRPAPNIVVTTESLPVVTTTASAPIQPPPLESPQIQQMVALIYKMIQAIFSGRPMEPGLREYLEFIYREMPQTFAAPTVPVIPTTTPSYEMQISPESTEVQPSVTLHEIRPTSVPPHVQSSLDSFEMRDSPDLFETQPSPHHPPHIQSSLDSFEMRDSPDLIETRPRSDPLEMHAHQIHSTSDSLQMRDSPDVFQIQPSSDPRQIQPSPLPPHVQSSLESLEMRDSPDLVEMQRISDALQAQPLLDPSQIQFSLDSPEVQPSVAQHEIQPVLPHIQISFDSLEIRDSPDLFETQPSSDPLEVQPTPDQRPIQTSSDSFEMRDPSPELLERQPSSEPLRIQTSPDPLQSSQDSSEMQISPELQETQPSPEPVPMQSSPEEMQHSPVVSSEMQPPHDTQVSMDQLEIQTGMEPRPRSASPGEVERMEVDTPSQGSSSSSSL